MSVERVRSHAEAGDELEGERHAPGSHSNPGSSSNGGPGSGRRHSLSSPSQPNGGHHRATSVASRRGSLHDLVRPADAHGEGSNGNGNGNGGNSARSEGQGEDGDGSSPHDDSSPDSISVQSRRLSAAPLPGAVLDDATVHEGTESEGEVAVEAIASATAAPLPIAYTTTLEQDAARDAARLAAQARQAEGEMRFGHSPSRSRSRPSRSRSRSRADQYLVAPDQPLLSGTGSGSDHLQTPPSSSRQHQYVVAEEDGEEKDTGQGPLLGDGQPHSLSDEMMPAPANRRRRQTSSRRMRLSYNSRSHLVSRSSRAHMEESDVEESKHHVHSSHHDIASPSAQAQSGAHPSDELPNEPSQQRHAASIDGGVLASPSAPVPPVEPTPTPEADEDEVPPFPRPARKYFPIDDPLAELQRLRMEKDFEPEFDDLFLPDIPGMGSTPSDRVGQQHPDSDTLRRAYEELQSLRVSESAAAADTHIDSISLDDVTLLDDILRVNHLSLEEAQQMEAELEAERIEDMMRDLDMKRRREHELNLFEQALKSQILALEEEHRERVRDHEAQLMQQHRLLQKEEQESFRRMEDEMRTKLKRKTDADINVIMQQLPTEGDKEKQDAEPGASGGGGVGVDDSSKSTQDQDLYAAVRSRRYSIDWVYEPRLVRIRIDWIRCIKNKLPLGHYQLMVTLYDRLGGDALRWSSVVDPRTGAALHPNTILPGSDHLVGQRVFSHTGSTPLAQMHGGKFYSLDLSFNQHSNRLFLACPPEVLSRPSMVFIFELFRCGDASNASNEAREHANRTPSSSSSSKRSNVLSSMASKSRALAAELLLKARNPKQYALLKAAQANAAAKALAQAPPSSDRAVAWGAFPMQYINFQIIKGRFKLPLLRGSYTGSGVEKFSTIHGRITKNLDNWLANLYFDIRPLPRNLDNATQHQVGMEFKGKGEESSSDEEEEEEEEEIQRLDESARNANAGDDIGAPRARQRRLAPSGSGRAARQQFRSPLASARGTGGFALDTDLSDLPSDMLVLDDLQNPLLSARAVGSEGDQALAAPHNSHNANRTSGVNVGVRFADEEDACQLEHTIDLRAEGRGRSDGAKDHDSNKEKKKGSSSATTTSDRRLRVKLHTRRFPGMLRDLADPDPNSKLAGMDGVGERRATPTSKHKYNIDLPFEEAAFHTTSSSSDNTVLGALARYKLRYIFAELWNDMGVRRWRDWQFLFLFIFVGIWCRLFIHYLGQYLFLSSINVPITQWDCTWYTCDVRYVWDDRSVTAETQIGVVVSGVFSNMIAMIIMFAAATLCQYVLGRTPAVMSRLLLGWGCGTVLEPFIILLIDICSSNWHGDSFKLYQYFNAKDGNGVSGIFMTILITAFLVVLSITFFYHYILYLHMNGRILDVHRRLHGSASSFFLPHDFEVSVRELRWILLKARRWVGMGGQKRKIAVTRFRSRDPLHSALCPHVVSTTIHVAIYTQSLNGDVELYRHFLRTADGTIVELFDAMEIPGEEAFRKMEEKLRQHERKIQALQNMAIHTFGNGGGGKRAHRSSASMDASNRSLSFSSMSPPGAPRPRPRPLNVPMHRSRDSIDLSLGTNSPTSFMLSAQRQGGSNSGSMDNGTSARNRFRNLAIHARERSRAMNMGPAAPLEQIAETSTNTPSEVAFSGTPSVRY